MSDIYYSVELPNRVGRFDENTQKWAWPSMPPSEVYSYELDQDELPVWQPVSEDEPPVLVPLMRNTYEIASVTVRYKHARREKIR